MNQIDYMSRFQAEWRNAEVYLRQAFHDKLSDEALLEMIPNAVRIMREDAIERREIEKLNALMREP
jgi:hypothetical protein